MSATDRRRGPGRGWVGLLGVLAALVGCLAMFSAVDQDWWHQKAEAQVSISGRAVTNGLAATIPTAVIAGLCLTLVFGPAGKRMLGLVVAALGIGVTLAAVGAVPPDDLSVRVGRDAAGQAVHSAMWTVFVAGAVAVVVGGLALAAFPGRARRHESRRATASDSPWVVLDRGEDPTIG